MKSQNSSSPKSELVKMQNSLKINKLVNLNDECVWREPRLQQGENMGVQKWAKKRK